MRLRITNCSDDNLKREIRQCIDFVMQYFFHTSKILTNVSLHVKIDDLNTKLNDAWGLCYCYPPLHRPRKFLIEISSAQTKKNFFTTLIHELIHVKQYLIGEMKDYESGMFKWKQVVYEKIDENKDQTQFPWEKQADKLSDKLYKIYSSK